MILCALTLECSFFVVVVFCSLLLSISLGDSTDLVKKQDEIIMGQIYNAQNALI